MWPIDFEKFRAKVDFTTTTEGGRSMPIKGRDYRPNMIIGNTDADVVVVSEKGDIINPGESRTIDIFIHKRNVLRLGKILSIGESFKLREGSRIIGEGTIIDKEF